MTEKSFNSIWGTIELDKKKTILQRGCYCHIVTKVKRIIKRIKRIMTIKKFELKYET